MSDTLYRLCDTCPDSQDRIEFIAEWVRKAVGCPQCDGTGGEWNYAPPGMGEPMPCPAEHAQLSILGDTIWADPTKCVWWCARSEVGYTPLDRDEDDTGCRIDDPPHNNCGWQPRMDALFGGAE